MAHSGIAAAFSAISISYKRAARFAFMNNMGTHRPHWSAGRCPRPDSTLLQSLWQHEVGTDWWSERERERQQTVLFARGSMLSGLYSQTL